MQTARVARSVSPGESPSAPAPRGMCHGCRAGAAHTPAARIRLLAPIGATSSGTKALGVFAVAMILSSSRQLGLPAILLAALGLGCDAREASPDAASPDAATQPGAAAKELEALRSRIDLSPDERALAVVDGAERWVDAQAAQAAGYTLIDLSDDWTPKIFAEEHTDDGVPLANRYRRVFIGLANDQLDSDGEPLEPGEQNYLELYGIFPSISVLRARMLQDAQKTCHDQESVAVLEAVQTVSYVAPEDIRRKTRLNNIRDDSRRAASSRRHRPRALAAAREYAAGGTARKRLRKPRAVCGAAVACEGLLTARAADRAGVYDDVMGFVARFQQKQ